MMSTNSIKVNINPVTIPKKTNLGDIFKDALTPEIENLFKDSGWHIYQSNEYYTDFEVDCTYKENDEDNIWDRYSFNLHLTINWEDREFYMVLGTNMGSGFNECVEISNDGSAFNSQINNKLSSINEGDVEYDYKILVTKHPLAWSGIIEGATKLSKALSIQ